jgi:transposase
VPAAIQEELEREIRSLKNFVHEQGCEIGVLKERVRLLTHELFGRRSERRPDDGKQSRLFNEAEIFASVGQAAKASVNVKEHARRGKKGRQSISAALRRVEIVHDVPAELKRGLHCIGDDACEKLVVVPEDVYVERHLYRKYARPADEHVEGEPAVLAAPRAPTLFPKSVATAALVAYLTVAKFCDHLPFYRIEKIFARWGAKVERASMCNWTIQAASGCKRMMELMEKQMLAGPLFACDETPMKVMNEPGRSNATDSYMWVMRGGPPGTPIIFFKYQETRAAGFLSELLQDFRGALLTDGWESYDSLAKGLDIVHAGCWDHARRKFVEAGRTAGLSRSVKAVLRLMGELYMIEREAREKNLSPEETVLLRQKQSAPRLRYFKKWLIHKAAVTPPKSSLGAAVAYTLNQWKKLNEFLTNGNIPISNILVENAIRPFVIGRKNWMLSGSPRGAEASAVLYSLVETAKANGLEPYWYLRYLFELLPLAAGDADIIRLAPNNATVEEISTFFKSQNIVAHPAYAVPART